MNRTRALGQKNSSPYSTSLRRFMVYVFDLAVLAAVTIKVVRTRIIILEIGAEEKTHSINCVGIKFHT